MPRLPERMKLQTSPPLQDRIAEKGHALSASSFERIVSIDGLRLLAAIGIVWFHTDGAPYRQIGYASLPIFLLVFFSLITNRSGSAPLAFLKRRSNRLLKPWLFWSLVYAFFRLAKGLYTRDLDSLRAMLSLKTVLTGTHVHLWYLPYAFVAAFLVYVLSRRTLRFNHTAVALIATAAALLMLVAHAMGLFSSRLPSPLPQWEFGLPAIPLGFAIGRCLMVPSWWRKRFLLGTIVLVTEVTFLVLTGSGHGSSVTPYSLAVVLVCLAYCWRTNASVIVATLAPLTFGVYLIHPLVILVLKRTAIASQHCVIFIGLTVCISGLLALGLRQTRLRQFV